MRGTYRERDPLGLGCIGCFIWLAVPVVLIGAPVIWGLNHFFGTDIGRDPNAPIPIVVQHVREFTSPDRKVLCRLGPVARCVTVSPPRSVTVNKNGIIHVCNGARCIGHVKLDGVPKLAYNHGAVYAGYSCRSDHSGITCFSDSPAKNFLINERGVSRSG